MNLPETKQDTRQDRAMVRMRAAAFPACGPGGYSLTPSDFSRIRSRSKRLEIEGKFLQLLQFML